MLFFALNTAPEALRDSIAAYRENIGNAKPYAGAVNNQVAGFVNSLCAEPEHREAVRWSAATKMVEHTWHGSQFMTTGWPDPDNIPASFAHIGQGGTADFKEAIASDPDGVARGLLESGMVAAGTPEDVLEIFQRFKDVGVDQIIVHMQMGGVPHQEIMKTIELLGNEVLPNLRD
jgi:alkanesulfonate monooxygenase SsuD/methylene tetrahydromethanopterin reductase-like flavin-dependent oxidoreductase (luciferase family)